MSFLGGLEKFSEEKVKLIEQGKITDKRSLNFQKLRLCKQFAMSTTPSNPDILALAKNSSPKILRILGLKPTRTLSGVAVVAIMPSPYKCPGKCIYCPNSLLPNKKTPKSYTGKEPATMRAINMGFDARKQILNRLKSLRETGHDTTKLELIIMGGTFPSMPLPKQKKFMLSALNAINNKKSNSLETTKKFSETAKKRVVGITFETRPDFCGKKEISRMLDMGGTRVELGVQNPSDEIYRRINRGHSVKDVTTATQLLKDSAFKVTYHFMPGLPGSTAKKDLASIKKIFSNPEFRPDSLKIYPCLVIKDTELFNLWKKGEFEPVSTEQAVKLVSKIKEFVPRHVRIMRIQRDIPHFLVEAGVQKTNLRQMVVEAFKIPTGSMKPTLKENNRIFVNKFIYRFKEPQRGDIIVFKYPEDTKKDFIKRVIATGGETVQISDGDIIIDGEPVDAPEIKSFYYYNRGSYGGLKQKIKVPDKSFYVLGDNSSSSRDSRYWGFVPRKYVIGKAIFRYWPPKATGKVK